MLAFTAKSLYTPLEHIERPLLLVDGRRIVEIASRSAKALPPNTPLTDYGDDAVLVPGFLDIHIHGGGGRDVMESDASSLSIIQKTLARHGVTSYLPTTVTAPMETTLTSLDRLAAAIEKFAVNGTAGAQPLGIHLEGPFLSHVRRGVHPPSDLLKPTVKIFNQLWEASRGHIRIITIAPELDGALEVIVEATKRGVCVSMGHSDANLTEARAGFTAGARHVTHVFNAMRPLEHRDPGILGEALTNSRLTAEVIADGIHLDPVIVQLVFQTKGLDGVVLITDATAGTDMPDGRYRLGTFEFEVKDGKCLSDGKLAGSILTMDRAVRNAMQFAGLDLQQALRAATLNPAKVAGLDRGVLKPGAQADFLVMNRAGEIQKTVLRGVEI
ncbi:MAG TPA: N-acetylglucosamine-6-phosphate deacetylase [Terriglobales bacterium]